MIGEGVKRLRYRNKNAKKSLFNGELRMKNGELEEQNAVAF